MYFTTKQTADYSKLQSVSPVNDALLVVVVVAVAVVLGFSYFYDMI